MVAIIVARSNNGVIGKNNELPWRLKKDRVKLKDLTKGQTVILGRKTYDSMVWYYDRRGTTMPAKTYIIVTRNHEYTPSRQNAIIAYSINDAIEKAKKLGEDTFIIGGAHIYEQVLPFTDRLYITEVATNVEGDTFFPEIDYSEWEEVAREKYYKDDQNEYSYDFVVLDRIKK